jgi:hypothetical protein
VTRASFVAHERHFEENGESPAVMWLKVPRLGSVKETQAVR